MTILLPATPFRCRYEVAWGRPFSPLERMVMRAVREQSARDIEELREIFHVHRRLLIEAVVTLIQAGWLALDGERGFVLTSEGAAAGVDSEPTTVISEPRNATVWMERVTGGVVRGRDVQFVNQRDLGEAWDNARRMRPEFDNRLDEGQIQHLLPRQKDEWVRWIGPIEPEAIGRYWLQVNVERDTGAILGVPDVWLTRLREEILGVAGVVSDSGDCVDATRRWWIEGAGAKEQPSGPEAAWSTHIRNTDLFVSVREHEDLLSRALRGAQERVVIASAFVSIEKLEHMAPRLREALFRNVDIDMLWGYGSSLDGEGNEAASRWLKKFSRQCSVDGAGGTIRVNRRPSTSHAKLLLWDDADGAVVAAVGSYNWLSANPERRSVNVTVRLRERRLVSALSRCAASLWSNAEEAGGLVATADRWRTIAAELEKRAVSTPKDGAEENCRVSLVMDRGHDGLLRRWMQAAERSLLVVSHKLGNVAQTRLMSARAKSHASDFVFEAVYGQSVANEGVLEKCSEIVRQAGGTLRCAPEVHAKVIVRDDAVCVTSYNPLSTDPVGRARYSREIGVVIEGREPTEWIRRRVMEET